MHDTLGVVPDIICALWLSDDTSVAAVMATRPRNQRHVPAKALSISAQRQRELMITAGPGTKATKNLPMRTRSLLALLKLATMYSICLLSLRPDGFS